MNELFGITPTNTLASASFDILKMDAVEDPLINVNKLATMDFEESYFSMAVDFINECRNELTTHKIAFYQSLNEASTETAILESFSDYFVKVKQIIDKFIKFIRNLVKKFINTLMKMVKSDSYLTKHKKDLDAFRDDNTFTFEGFNYTFSPDVPSAIAALTFNNSLFDDLYAKHTDGMLTIDGIKLAVADMDLEKDYNEFRAKVLNKANEIYLTDFADELYKVYRDDKSDTERIDADKTYVRRTTDRYFSYSKTKSTVERQRQDIENAYLKVQKQVEEIVRRNGDLNAAAFLNKLPSDSSIKGIDSKALNVTGITMSADLMAQLDIYVRAKVDQIQEYSNIHILAFSAKLDAMKEAYKQDRNVLYTALNKIKVEDMGGK